MNLNATFIVQLVVFFILVAFTMKFIWPPMMKALDERAQKIADGLAVAERTKLESVAAQDRIQEELSSARDIVQKRIAEAERRAQSIIEKAKTDAMEEALAIVASAKADQEQQMKRAKDELRRTLAALAVKGAEQILKREIDEAAHADLLHQLKAEL